MIPPPAYCPKGNQREQKPAYGGQAGGGMMWFVGVGKVYD
jgi:hypothetical protein